MAGEGGEGGGGRDDPSATTPRLAKRPQAVLFACTFNAVRSPMAEAIVRHLFGREVFVASAGVRHGELDPFAVAAMDEIGIDIQKHKPHTFAELEDDSFDLIVSLSPEAHHTALEYTRTMAVDVLYWPTIDPTVVQGSREQMLDAYRNVRDGLQKRIKDTLGWRPMMPRREE
ncbi:MAG: arsC 3 [Hyphomicrobiales bacterium]|nr:arsC 3 [Hyphomicrobiales bacterium]